VEVFDSGMRPLVGITARSASGTVYPIVHQPSGAK